MGILFDNTLLFVDLFCASIIHFVFDQILQIEIKLNYIFYYMKFNTPTMSSTIHIQAYIKSFKTHGIKTIESLNESQIVELIRDANQAYYNKTPVLTDNEYDIIREYAERTFPDNKDISAIGAPPAVFTKNKVKLPYNMPSMDKIKPDTNALDNWKERYNGPYVLSQKLDGVSGMYITGEEPRLYTRGDGTIGQDITHFIRHLPRLPNIDTKIAVRGEFIIPKYVFDEKYKDEFANPRNLVSGIINSKSVDEKISDIHFVAYEIIYPPMKPSDQLHYLYNLNFNVVGYQVIPKISNEYLSKTLINWRTNCSYEIDGVIVTDNSKYYERTDKNPTHAFAFKMVITDQIAEAKVVDVLWEPSKDGYLKPRVQIEPIQLCGVTIQYATGFNANFIESNQIGVGAVVQIIRSGDVIPYIKEVVQPAENPKMPEQEYHWNKNHIDIILDNAQEDATVKCKNITEFFKWLQVDGLSNKTVERIMEVGFDSIPKILKMTKTDFAKVRGFKDTMVNKIHDGIKQKVQQATILDLMIASNLFGRGIGERKIKPIVETYPDILTNPKTLDEKYQDLIQIRGIGTENAQSFVNGIESFLMLLRETGLEHKLDVESAAPVSSQKVDTKHPLYDMHVVMTKIRDKEIIEKLKEVGGHLDDTIGKNTAVLIVKSKEDVTVKTKNAQERGIPIMEPAEFKAKYF
jgi:DNA ligase (NAD+)